MLFGGTLSPRLLEINFRETKTDFLVSVFLRSLALYFGFLYSVFLRVLVWSPSCIVFPFLINFYEQGGIGWGSLGMPT